MEADRGHVDVCMEDCVGAVVWAGTAGLPRPAEAERGPDGLPVLPPADLSSFHHTGATPAQRVLWNKAFLWLGSDAFQPHLLLESREPMAFGIPEKCMGEWMDVGRVMTALFPQSGQETGEHMRLLYLQKVHPPAVATAACGGGECGTHGGSTETKPVFPEGGAGGALQDGDSPTVTRPLQRGGGGAGAG
eukprot:1542965-Rhodomonas_salina.1